MYDIVLKNLWKNKSFLVNLFVKLSVKQYNIDNFLMQLVACRVTELYSPEKIPNKVDRKKAKDNSLFLVLISPDYVAKYLIYCNMWGVQLIYLLLRIVHMVLLAETFSGCCCFAEFAAQYSQYFWRAACTAASMQSRW